MALTQVQGGLLESGAALNNIGAGGITPSYLSTQSQYTGFKNRIINGAMMIDQRGSASSPVYSNVSSYAVDRMKFFGTGGGVFTSQQSTVAPSGFTNSNLLTVTTADSSIAAGDLYWFGQAIEGYNVADLGWGAAVAQTVTLSFWVRSSVTGTFSGSLNNGAYDRSYLFTYAINSANTWEQKTITVTGDTSGTWLKTNGVGLYVILDLGAGSTYANSTSGSWLSGGYQKVTGTTNWIATNGATFYITGVQLEKGSTATSFDYRPYGTELALCQRYYYVSPACTYGYPSPSSGGYASIIRYDFKVTMRANATVTTTYSSQSNVSGTPGAISRTTDFFSDQIISTGLSNVTWVLTYTASAEL